MDVAIRMDFLQPGLPKFTRNGLRRVMREDNDQSVQFTGLVTDRALASQTLDKSRLGEVDECRFGSKRSPARHCSKS